MPAPRENNELNEKQKAFGREYVFDWNGAQAAIRAGYSPKTAKEQASRLLTNVNLQNYISEIQENLAKLAGISALSQISELKKIAYSNIADYFNDWDKLKPFSDLTEDQKAALLEINYKKDMRIIGGIPTDIETEFVKLKNHSKQDAIKEINKMLGFYAPDKIEIENTNTQPIFQNISNHYDIDKDGNSIKK